MQLQACSISNTFNTRRKPWATNQDKNRSHTRIFSSTATVKNCSRLNKDNKMSSSSVVTAFAAVLLLLLCQQNIEAVHAFVSSSPRAATAAAVAKTSTLALQKMHPAGSDDNDSMINSNNNKKNSFGVSFLAAAFVAGNVLSAGLAPAMAMEGMNSNNNDIHFGGGVETTQLLAARSGGRAGGRSAGGRMAPSPAARSSTSTTTRVIERTRYVPTPGVVGGGYGYGGPSVIIAPPVYNPLPGYGLGLGLSAINQIGNDMRDYRQESEIQNTRAQLQQSQMREAEMEARLRQLETASQQQGGQLNQQQQQQLLMLMQQQQQMLQQQQPVAAAAP